MPADDHPDNYSMSFGDHLEELRARILWGLAVPLPLAVLTFIFSESFIRVLYRPLDGVLEALDQPRRLQALGPAEVLMTQLKLSLIVALVVSGPWILWQAWLFIKPGLYKHERRFVYFLVPGSAILTATGLLLMYFVMLPLMLRVLVVFGSSISLGAPDIDPRLVDLLADTPAVTVRTDDPVDPKAGELWLRWPQMDMFAAVTARDANAVEIVRVPPPEGAMITQQFQLTTYINFVLLLMLGIAIAFQMPLVLLLLGWLDIISEATLRKRRKHAIFTLAIVSAVITPADAPSMIMMLVPLVALFELSIVLMRLVPVSRVVGKDVIRSP